MAALPSPADCRDGAHHDTRVCHAKGDNPAPIDQARRLTSGPLNSDTSQHPTLPTITPRRQQTHQPRGPTASTHGPRGQAPRNHTPTQGGAPPPPPPPPRRRARPPPPTPPPP